MKKNKQVVIQELFDHVFDVGTYTSLDYDYTEKYHYEKYYNWGGGCSAVAKTLKNGQTIVGRNMDLNISNKAAYIVRTDVKGSYKTLGLAYTFRDYSPDYKEVKEKGLSKEFETILPFICDDVINSEGLYIEVNMRYGEFWPTGQQKFSCKGTNPKSKTNVYMFELARYIGEHCATVKEAVKYVKSLNVYSKEGYWNYCFLMADRTGHYGVLEFAKDLVLWNEDQPAQTNFYINRKIRQIEELRCGVGRYNHLMNNIKNVENEVDMYDLIRDVSYYQVYTPYDCKFNPVTENVGLLPFATYDLLVKEENREIILEAISQEGRHIKSLSRQEQQDANCYWESTFTEVVNCNERTIFVRFFEDESKTISLKLI